MTHFNNFRILYTRSDEPILLDLGSICGQPSTTTIYLEKNTGETIELDSFDNNTDKRKLGEIEELGFHSLKIHTTIHDIRDSVDEQTDIGLNIKVYNNTDLVEITPSDKTQGMGGIYHSFFTVIIIKLPENQSNLDENENIS